VQVRLLREGKPSAESLAAAAGQPGTAPFADVGTAESGSAAIAAASAGQTGPQATIHGLVSETVVSQAAPDPIAEIRDDVDEPVLIPGNPVKMSRVAEGPETRVPWVGEHTAEVLETELGLSAEDLAALRARGVVS